MAQMTVRQLRDDAVARLRVHAVERGTSVESIARDSIHRVAEQLTRAEKLALVQAMQQRTRGAMVPGARQTSGLELIREDRDHHH